MYRKSVQGMLAGATSINHSLTHCPGSLASSIALLTCSRETTMLGIFSLSLHVHCPPSSFLLSVPRGSPGGLALPDASHVFWLLVGCGQWGALAGDWRSGDLSTQLPTCGFSLGWLCLSTNFTSLSDSPFHPALPVSRFVNSSLFLVFWPRR